jgi:hypothetical protein
MYTLFGKSWTGPRSIGVNVIVNPEKSGNPVGPCQKLGALGENHISQKASLSSDKMIVTVGPQKAFG